MPATEARFIKKKVKTGTVDIHPTENSLIVNYEVEAFILGEDGQPMIGDRKKCQKMIRFHSLNPSTNCSVLARDVINKCKLIHPSKLDEVQHLLRYLQYRKQCAPAISDKLLFEANSFDDAPATPCKTEEKVSLLDIEDYIELLYEDMADKIRGSSLILQLAKDSANLDELSKNESLTSVLSRLLREDWKKSVELSNNLVSIFACFTEYTAFHHIVLKHKIGSLCLEIVDHELSKGTTSEPDSKVEKFRSRLPVPRNAKSAVPENSRKKSLIPVTSRRLSLAIEDKPIDNRRTQEDVRKYDMLLVGCFMLLLNISENQKIEDKMRRRQIVQLLVRSLDRKLTKLLSVVVQFLLKLSLYKENIDTMVELDTVEKLPRLLMISENEESMLEKLLKLMYNLSFDRRLCEQMIRVGFLPEMIKLIKRKKFRKLVFGLLYHFTMDDRVKSMFAYTDSMNIIINSLLDNDIADDNIFKALCVNLALNSKNAEAMCDHRCISAIMRMAFQNKDLMYMKMARNVVSHQNTKHMFEIYAPEIAKLIITCIKSDKIFCLECIGFLANLSTKDVDFPMLFKRFQLFSLIKQCFTDPGYVNDDIRLELLVLLGNVAYDEVIAEALIQNDIIVMLIDLINDKQEDDEVVLQIIFVFYQILQHPMTRDYVTKQTKAPLYFVDLLHDNNPNVRKLCETCLDIIKDFDDSWTENVKLEKFKWHNSHWLEMIQNQMLSQEQFESGLQLEDDTLPRYDLYQQSLMFQSGSGGSHMSLSVDGSVDGRMEVVSNMNSDSSQSVSGYNSDVELDMEVPERQLFDDRYDIQEDFRNLIISGNID